MRDKSLSRALTVIALALSILAAQSISAGLFNAHAQTPPERHCVWTYIVDESRPNIGKDGNVDFSKGANWKKLSDEGWVLKAAPSANTYVFERCQ